MVEVYVALGGNIGESTAVLKHALEEIGAIPEVFELRVSRFYQTSPVGGPEQQDYMNAVCVFKTGLEAPAVHDKLQKIEKKLGKTPKPKDAPRIIDLDILFYGTEWHDTDDLQIPHPRWEERLFVLVPLLDLVEELAVPGSHGVRRVNLREKLKHFSNKHHEVVQEKG